MNKPDPKLLRTPRDAEAAARDWMFYLGWDNAFLTSSGADGGVDVRASGAVAQVKAQLKPTGRPEVQQLHGVASHESAEALFFSLGGFTDAVDLLEPVHRPPNFGR
jgi:hypothetical protein